MIEDIENSGDLIDRMPESKVALDTFINGLEIGENKAENKKFIEPILSEAQKLFGYIPDSVQRYVADRLNIFVPEITLNVNFFPHLSTELQEKHKITICTGRSCQGKGSTDILAKIREQLSLEGLKEMTEDMIFKVETARCLGSCKNAATIKIDQDIMTNMTPEGAMALVASIIEKEKS